MSEHLSQFVVIPGERAGAALKGGTANAQAAGLAAVRLPPLSQQPANCLKPRLHFVPRRKGAKAQSAALFLKLGGKDRPQTGRREQGVTCREAHPRRRHITPLKKLPADAVVVG